jgi:hypothetical protein
MTRTYHMEELRRNLFLVVGVVLAAFGVLWPVVGFLVLGDLTLDILDIVVVGLPSAFFLGLGRFVANAGRTIRLELSQEAIVLHLPAGGRLSADWDDVAELGPAPWGPLTGQALILRRPGRLKKPLWYLLLGSPEMERAITLSPFALPLRGSRLEADLRSRLPHLFD